jgi:hypothetical protein
MHYSSAYINGYRNKSWGLLAGKCYGDHAEALRAWQTRYEGDPADGNNIMCIARVHAAMGDEEKAIELIDSDWRQFLDEKDVLKEMMVMLDESDGQDILHDIYAALIDSKSADFPVYYDYASLKFADRELDSAMYYYDLAYRTLGHTRINEQFAFYVSAFIEGYDDISIGGLMRINDRLDGDNRSMALHMLKIISESDGNEIDSLRTFLKRQRDLGQRPQNR